MPTLYLISKSKPPTARWEQVCLEQPDGDEVIVPCRTAGQIWQRAAVIFATTGKHRVFLRRVTVSSSAAHLPAWGMGKAADTQGLCALWGHGLSCVSREADRGAESLRPPLPQHSPPRAAEPSGPGPYMEQGANMESVSV